MNYLSDVKIIFRLVYCEKTCYNVKARSPSGEIGRRSRLKICRSQICAGSSPASGTNMFTKSLNNP